MIWRLLLNHSRPVQVLFFLITITRNALSRSWTNFSCGTRLIGKAPYSWRAGVHIDRLVWASFGDHELTCSTQWLRVGQRGIRIRVDLSQHSGSWPRPCSQCVFLHALWVRHQISHLYLVYISPIEVPGVAQFTPVNKIAVWFQQNITTSTMIVVDISHVHIMDFTNATKQTTTYTDEGTWVDGNGNGKASKPIDYTKVVPAYTGEHKKHVEK